MRYFIAFLFFSALVVSCNNFTDYEENYVPRLLFSSGFEDNVYIEQPTNPNYADYEFIKGEDISTGFSWPIDILGSSNSGLHYINDDNKQAVFSELRTVRGHNGNQTRVLYQEENYAFRPDTQCPYEILDLTQGKNDLYIKYWMKIDSAGMSQPNKWRALFEYKTKAYAQGLGFRLIAFIYNDSLGRPYWHFQGDTAPDIPLWEVDNFDVPVPLNQWFKTEFYWKWSETGNGRMAWKINGQLVGEHIGSTTVNNQPIDLIMLTQIYGDANPKKQWIDDIQIWEGAVGF